MSKTPDGKAWGAMHGSLIGTILLFVLLPGQPALNLLAGLNAFAATLTVALVWDRVRP